ncbi:Fe-S cluster assembly protein SufD [Rubricoccus marinus]|uniref:Fe-S cluster assembly protein SufD n=1 Tax=Rubricoccus marinus TaxID=716817 RepID=A0A259TZD6_9BACT|nr:Fe-S cluster assembly protein SufD [Rubricoccus marinus]OZC03129.1 Fe-S cluster assembly protein SufD [Rubricoccus marinus]
MLDVTTRPDLFGQAAEEFDRAFSGDGAPRPFADLRAKSRQHFEALGLPTKKLEAWKYTDLRPALKEDYQFAAGDGTSTFAPEAIDAFAIPGLDAARLVVVNGAVVDALSDLSALGEGVTVGSLREAAQENGAVIAEYFGKFTETDQNAFAALNSAFDLDGFFVHVAKGVEVKTPIHVIHLVEGDQPTFVQTRHLVVVEDNARVRIVESYVASGETPQFGNHLVEIAAGPGSAVRHVRIQDEGSHAHAITTTNVYQDRDSDVHTHTFTFDTGLVRNNTTAVLGGPGGNHTVGGLYILHGEQHVDTSTLIDHEAPACESNELFKGICYDKTTGVFNGKVFVARPAQQTNAYQQSQGVILSPDARHFSKPELEIYADDVKCSHGSTTGAIDPEALFYLRARGLSLSDARALLLYAFAHDVVAELENEPLQEFLDARISERLT